MKTHSNGLSASVGVSKPLTASIHYLDRDMGILWDVLAQSGSGIAALLGQPRGSLAIQLNDEDRLVPYLHLDASTNEINDSSRTLSQPNEGCMHEPARAH